MCSRCTAYPFGIYWHIPLCSAWFACRWCLMRLSQLCLSLGLRQDPCCSRDQLLHLRHYAHVLGPRMDSVVTPTLSREVDDDGDDDCSQVQEQSYGHTWRCTVLYCTVLYCTVLYCTVLYCTVLYCTVLYCTVLYCTVLYCVVLYCTVLYCTVTPLLYLLSCYVHAANAVCHCWMTFFAFPRTRHA